MENSTIAVSIDIIVAIMGGLFLLLSVFLTYFLTQKSFNKRLGEFKEKTLEGAIDSTKLTISEQLGTTNRSITEQLGVSNSAMPISQQLGVSNLAMSISQQLGVDKNSKSITGQLNDIKPLIEQFAVAQNKKDIIAQTLSPKELDIKVIMDKLSEFSDSWQAQVIKNAELENKNLILKQDNSRLLQRVNELENELERVQ